MNVPAAAPAAPPAAMMTTGPPAAEPPVIYHTLHIPRHAAQTDHSFFAVPVLQQLAREAGFDTHEIDVRVEMRLEEPNLGETKFSMGALYRQIAQNCSLHKTWFTRLHRPSHRLTSLRGQMLCRSLPALLRHTPTSCEGQHRSSYRLPPGILG